MKTMIPCFLSIVLLGLLSCHQVAFGQRNIPPLITGGNNRTVVPDRTNRTRLLGRLNLPLEVLSPGRPRIVNGGIKEQIRKRFTLRERNINLPFSFNNGFFIPGRPSRTITRG